MTPAYSASASTFFLKSVLVCIAIAVLVACAILFPRMWGPVSPQYPMLASVQYPGVIGFQATLIPFLIALYQAFTLLRFIDKNEAFSESSVRALRLIKYSAVAMSVGYAIAMPMVYVFAELDDAPGAILLGAAITCAPLVVATFAAVLQKLVQSAIALKVENDLTV